AVSAMSVNWETTSTAPPTSKTERSKRPVSSGKIRSRATLPASRRASSSPSPRATPSSTQSPRPISPPGPTRARDTRCTTALMGRRYRRAPRSSDCAAGLPRGALLLQLANAGPILVRLGPERARELVVPVRLGVPALLLEAAAERVVRVVVDRRELEQLAELGFGL